MEWDLVLRVCFFVLGSVLVLSFGHLVWNYRLLYYRLWCWLQYGRTGEYWYRK